MTSLSRLGVIVAPEDSIDVTVRRMAERSKEVAHAGIALVLEAGERLAGIVTDGDLRRAYASDIPFSRPVSDIMIDEPVMLPADTPPEQIVPEVYRRVRKSGRLRSEWIRHVLLVDDDRRLVDVQDFLDLLERQGGGLQQVAVFGMGYVGLTLAVALANRGHQVVGLEIVPERMESLSQGKPYIHEPGLAEMLRVNLARHQIAFDVSLGAHQHGVYIVAVGTPLDEEDRPDLSALLRTLDSIGPLLKRGDQIMLRSTIPVGTTREVVIPYVEKLSGLVAGVDFHVAFAPERTVEGRAMQELRTLPQVVGGYTQRCLQRAAEFWWTLTPSVIQVSSLEAAEIVKLANNTFRDLSFAFANEIAMLADTHNVDAFELVRAANDGYPRNPISFPSPGVGGYCLTKDPVLYGSTPKGRRSDIVLGRAGRAVNERAAQYPIDVIERFAKRAGRSVEDLSVLLVGIAFKGRPETTDLRGSVALDVASKLKGTVRRLQGWDAVVARNDIISNGMDAPGDLAAAIEDSDVVLIMNNHPDNTQCEAYVSPPPDSRLIFDGWHQLDAREIEIVDGVTYATMGYMSPDA